MYPKSLLEKSFAAAVAAADPLKIVPAHLPATPKERTLLIGAGKAAASMAKAVEVFRAAGVTPVILGDTVTGEAREAAKAHAAIARASFDSGQPFKRPVALISGGECTVTLKNPNGRGGRVRPGGGYRRHRRVGGECGRVFRTRSLEPRRVARIAGPQAARRE